MEARRVGMVLVDSAWAGGEVLQIFFLIVTGLIVSCPWFPAHHVVIRGLSVWIGAEGHSQFNEAALSQAFTPLNRQELCCSLSFQEHGGEKKALQE